MESPEVYPDTPLETPMGDAEEIIYPCKGCGEILEEGKAFELAGNRWHIDCFRCNTCGTLLDSDANLLLLGDGSLICNNCTYSCSACGNKIEDLAILTGEQAFCASCFKCRNCKRQIENLRYARTSQGIFCMACHESLMARRRKKSKASRQHASNNFDKSLPALPPNANFPSTDLETPPSEAYSETPSDMSPAQGPKPRLRSKKESSMANLKREASPNDAVRKGLSSPQSTRSSIIVANANPETNGYDRRHSGLMNVEEASGDDGFFVPLALDNNPAPLSTPQPRRRLAERPEVHSTLTAEETKAAKDYFSRPPHSASHRDVLKENGNATTPRSGSLERDPQRSGSGSSKPTPSPHIAYQEKGRQPSAEKADTVKKRKEQGITGTQPVLDSPEIINEKSERSRPQLNPQGQGYPLRSSTNSEIFKLQEVPRNKRTDSRRSSKSDSVRSPGATSPADADSTKLTLAEVTMDAPLTTGQTSQSSGTRYEDAKSHQTSPETTKHSQHPMRGDSLAALRSGGQPNTPQSAMSKALTESQVSSPHRGHDRKASTSSISVAFELPADSPKLNGNISISKPIESPISKSVLDPPPALPSRNSSRKSPTGPVPVGDSFVAPRAPPPAPSSDARHKTNGSVGSNHTEYTEGLPSATQPTIPEHTAAGEMSMEEEMARIIRNEDGTVNGSMMRRVSNAVKHGRSFSDRGSQKWRSPGTNEWNSPKTGQMEISSPLFPDADGKEDIAQLKNQLRRARSKIAELEAERDGLQEKVNGSADIKQVNTELREKRSTMAFLDTQREMVVKELEIMTDHLAKVKNSNQPLDLDSLQSDILTDFTNSMQKLKDSLGQQIEDLIHKRNELTEEISNLIQMKDKGFQEYESLSTKNQQLSELNSQLVHNIQDLYKANRTTGNSLDGGRPHANGLGIYTNHHKDRSETSSTVGTSSTLVGPEQQSRNGSVAPAIEVPIAALASAEDAEPISVLSAPQVVNIRKGQPKKFNWKKGSSGVTTKIQKTFKSFTQPTDRYPSGQVPREGQYSLEGTPYGQMPSREYPNTDEQSREREISQPRMQIGEPMMGRKEPGFGSFFSGQKEKERGNNALKPGSNANLKTSSSNANLVSAEPPSVLFGSDLTARCNYEGLLIPSIITHCIAEVEARGMEQEGIYRKSGGSGQVKMVQTGFEKDGAYDISDPDLDIHAVSSAVKQYLRKLPIPLISPDVYDVTLEAARSIEDPKERAITIKSALGMLPKSHADVLELLMRHLSRVMELERVNLMTALNLSVVFAPTIMRPPSLQQEMEDMMDQRRVVQTMLENVRLIFGDGDDSRAPSALSELEANVVREDGSERQREVDAKVGMMKESEHQIRRLPIPR